MDDFPVSLLLRYIFQKSKETELFWSVFSRILSEYGEILYLSVVSPNTRKYGPE